MPPVMDLMEVSRRTELPIRRLRYVLEHRVLPGALKASRGHRIAREFTAFECFGIACAAAMLQAGLRRPLVQRCVRCLLRPVRHASRQDNHLARIQRSSGAAVLEIADGHMIRVSGARDALRPIFRRLNLNLWLTRGEGRKGSRAVRVLTGGVITTANAALPRNPYGEDADDDGDGPSAGGAAGGALPPAGDANEASSVGVDRAEDVSFSKVHRGDKL